MSVNAGSRGLPSILTKVPASQQCTNAAMSSQNVDTFTLVNILNQAFEAPNMELRPSGGHGCSFSGGRGSRIILPRSCMLSDNISTEDVITFTSGGLTGVWKGYHNGTRMCIKKFRAHAGRGSSKIKQRWFKEIMVWRHLSHPNVLPVLGVLPESFPLCVVTKWMVNGNIMNFTSEHSEVNRLHLLAEASQGLQYLHSICITHNRLKPENILIDHDCHPHLTDYGLPLRLEVVEDELHCLNDLQYLAPELLDPTSFGLKKRTPTKESDVFAFGMVIYQVLTGQQPFPGVRYLIIDGIVAGTRPHLPPCFNEWPSDGVWNLISRCWSPSWDHRPDPGIVMNVLSDAGDAIELRSKGFREADLLSFFNGCKGVLKNGQDTKKAQAIVNVLDLTLCDGDLHERKRKRCLKYLRKFCGTFSILPSSFMVEPTSYERETEPFATGGFSYVYKATFNGLHHLDSGWSYNWT